MTLVAMVLLTWLTLIALSLLLGAFAGRLARPRVSSLGAARVALWTGLAVLLLTLAITNFFVPLRSAAAVITVAAVATVGIAAWLVVRGIHQIAPLTGTPAAHHRQWWVLVPIAALLGALLVFAHAFAGPVHSYDAGLYHLNAIQYASEYRIIPGLANLHERLGGNVTSFLLAAFLGNGFWGIDAFRLVVGAFIALFCVDLTLRLLDRRQRSGASPGLFVMLLAAALALPFLLGSPEHWVTSPTPDSVSMILAIVAIAYAVDAFWWRSALWSAMAVLVAVLAATVRTQLWVLAALLILVLFLHWWRWPSRDRSPLVIVTAVLSVLLVIVMMIRDVILSGWLLFPASSFPMPVEWRVPDPAASRVWILSWARDPGSSPEETMGNWSWLGGWIARNATDWATAGSVGGLAASVAVFWFARALKTTGGGQLARARVGWRGLTLLLVPVVASVGVWFWTAPDPRFAWGPILAIGVIPLALALASIGPQTGSLRPVAVLVVASLATASIAGPALVRLVSIRGYVADGYENRIVGTGPLAFAAAVNPVESKPVTEFRLDGGQTILTPVEDDRCFLTFPLCRPYPDATLIFRGESTQDGFISGQQINE